jgi:hypothetical protein
VVYEDSFECFQLIRGNTPVVPLMVMFESLHFRFNLEHFLLSGHVTSQISATVDSDQREAIQELDKPALTLGLFEVI